MTTASLVPPFLKLTPLERKKRFLYINAESDQRLEDAISIPHADWTIDVALEKSNLAKNRYSNVFPWDQNRVRLPVSKEVAPGDEHKFNYVNASYITINDQVKYIASQGPLSSTTHHFWAMAWNESESQDNDTIIIAMITPLNESGMVKCFQYWPDKTSEDEPVDFSRQLAQDQISIDGGKLAIRYLNETYVDDGDYLLTEMELISSNKTKKVYHYYYYKWADCRTPESIRPLLALSNSINTVIKEVTSRGLGAPVPIVHCSAGVGRTGTFIAIDQLFGANSILKSSHKSADPIFDFVLNLRNNRMMMVQTIHQYNFLYDSALQLYHERLRK